MNEPPLYVLDSFAALAFLQAEPGGPRVRSLFDSANREEVRLLMAVVNLGEVFYKTIHKAGSQDRANEVLGILQNQYSIEFIDVDRDLALRGARLKGSHAMSYADCIAAALAQRIGATLVTGDPEFRAVEGRVQIEWLPQPDRR